MTRVSRRTSRSRGSRPLRPFEWGGTTITGVIAENTTFCSWVIDPVAVQLLHEPTLMRMLINWHVSVQSQATGTATIGGMGVIRWSGDPDSAAAPADCPDPVDDANLDWAYFTYLPTANNSGVSASTLLSPGQAVVDIGSMRKLSNSEGLLFAINAPGGLSYQIAIGVRYLFKQ